MAEELDGRIQEVEKSLGTVESQMRAQIESVQSGTRTTLVVGFILVVIVLGYLGWLTNRIKIEIQPETLAETVNAKMQDYAKEQLPVLEQTLKDQAPAAVAKLRTEMMARVVPLREEAEKRLLGYVDGYVGQLETKLGAVVTDVLQKNHDELQPLIEAAATPGNADNLRQMFQESLEEAIGPKLDEVLKDFDWTMTVINIKLDRLLGPENKLAPEEKLEKELIGMIMTYIDEAVTEQLNAPLPPVNAPQLPRPRRADRRPGTDV